MLETATSAGSSKTPGEKTGERMALGTTYSYSRCILINQEELGLERFTLAVALNNDNIDEGDQEEINVEEANE